MSPYIYSTLLIDDTPPYVLDMYYDVVYDNRTTTSTSGYPHPLLCGFFMLCQFLAVLSIIYTPPYDGSREPNTIPPVGNTLRRLVAVVEARCPMPTKHVAALTTNLRGDSNV